MIVQTSIVSEPHSTVWLKTGIWLYELFPRVSIIHMSCESSSRFECRFAAFAITKEWPFLRVQVFDVQLQ